MKVLVFAGTTEGRKIAEWLDEHRIESYVSVATEYGSTLLEACKYVHVMCGRMNVEEMEAFLVEKQIDVVVDATHPFAEVVTENIQSACKKCGTENIRCLRSFDVSGEMSDHMKIVSSIPEAVSYLEGTSGNILISTGSKELQEYTKLTDYKERCYARVLSVKESVEKSIALGFEGKHLIAMQGPFSKEMNTAMLRSVDASYFVTKESGKTGGFYEKLEAARACDVTLIVIGRPAEEGESVGEVCEKLQELVKQQKNVKQQTSAKSQKSATQQKSAEVREAGNDRNSHNHTQYVWKAQKQLRTGYTTGSCAAAAAKAAAHMLFTGEEIKEVSLVTPSGVKLYLEVHDIVKKEYAVYCAIRKDSGDDPDVTNGTTVYSLVSMPSAKGETDPLPDVSGVTSGSSKDRSPKEPWGITECPNIVLKAGRGIGRVTKKGLEQWIGEPAINVVPRQMICGAVWEELKASELADDHPVEIVIWIPEGETLASKTFNPRLGIEGGISVLGTSGIVEPMSEKALTDTIFLDMKMKREQGYDYCFVVPGNYGVDFLRESIGYTEEKTVKCSNYIGEVIDDAVRLGMKGILLVGHIGKLVKIAAGIMNTHSKQADGRMEILAAHAAMAGARREVSERLMQCVTTVDALEVLKEEGLLESVMATIMERIEEHLTYRAGETLLIGAIVFSKEMGILGKTKDADTLLDYMQN